MIRRRSLVGSMAVSCSLLALAGCSNRLAFGTATKFGLDVSQRPDQTVEMTLGYDRMEIIVIPTYTAKDGDRLPKDATADADTYSVLGTFQVVHGNPFSGQGLVIHQFFATGRAADLAGRDAGFQQIFGTEAGNIFRLGQKETTSPSGAGVKQ